MLIYRSPNVQLFGFTPDPRRRQMSTGVALRVRGRRRWRHFRVAVSWLPRERRDARGFVGVEAVSWLTAPGMRKRRSRPVGLQVRLQLGGRIDRPHVADVGLTHRIVWERLGGFDEEEGRPDA